MTVCLLAAAAYAYVYYNSFFERTSDAHVVTQSTSLNSKVSGKVAKMLVKETQVVKAGDPLVQIDPKQFQAELDQKQAELDRAEERLTGGRIYLERLQKSAAEGGDVEKQKYDGARKWYYHIQGKTQELRDGVAAARARVKATTVLAPADGHVAKKMVDAGATVTEGQPLIEFVGAVQPWLIANFKEIQLEKMQLGQRVSIRVPGVEHSFVGKVESLPAKPQAAVAPTRVEKLLGLVSKTAPRVSVRIAFDPKSVQRDVNRLTNDAPADVKVYIK